jgi:hypothetical protein
MMKTSIFAIATLFALTTSALAQANLDKAWSDEDIGAIPFEDGLDESGNPDAQSIEFAQKWKGKTIVMLMGGIKLSENYATCTPRLKGARPQSMIKGNLLSRMRGGSGGNPIDLTNCMIVKK